MKAARFHGRGDVRVEDVTEPHPGPGQVQIAVDWCGICGTDLHEYLDGPIFAPTPANPHPLTGGAVPITLGHEFSGVVAELGSGVTGFAEGDRVVVEPYDVCGECIACRDGRYNTCRKLGFIGLDGEQGGFAERMVVDQRWVHSIEGLTPEQGALVEPLAVGYHATKLSGCAEGGTRPPSSGPARSAWSPPPRCAPPGRGRSSSSSPPRPGRRRPPAPARTTCSTRPRSTSRRRSASSPTGAAPT